MADNNEDQSKTLVNNEKLSENLNYDEMVNKRFDRLEELLTKGFESTNDSIESLDKNLDSLDNHTKLLFDLCYELKLSVEQLGAKMAQIDVKTDMVDDNE
jgi:predicted nuclease with TOPRIM domain